MIDIVVPLALLVCGFNVCGLSAVGTTVGVIVSINI